jgi:O-acetyl-ADP-ribose deacetylase (regulator of RNase III)
MILYVEGNLLQSPAQVFVNTVNTVGVMGRGIALDFKRLYPEMYEEYRDLCEKGELRIGTLWLYKSANKWVLNFPTKQHWRQPSRPQFIEAGLRKFASNYDKYGIYSIAFPALGCGNGQLDFATQVKPLMEKYLRNLPIEVFIYPGWQSSFVEHLQQEEMREWLRSEPSDLPFSEVWEDLTDLLESKHVFATIARKSPFEAWVDGDAGIRVSSFGQSYFMRYEALMAFWQQLRVHGFSMRHIAPGLDRVLSYLIPIFAELTYVTPVQVAEDYEDLGRGSAVIGLQVLPSAFMRDRSLEGQGRQLLLFEHTEAAWST